MITKKEFIETRDLTEFAREKGTTSKELYDRYNLIQYQKERNSYWYDMLNDGLVSADYKEEYYDDAKELISELVENGHTLRSISKLSKLPFKTIERYLSSIGETTTATADEHFKPLMEEYAELRKKSREIYFRELHPLVTKEKELKNKIIELYDKGFTKKKIKHKDIIVRKFNGFNKNNISVSQLLKLIPEDKLREHFGVELVDKIIITSLGLDKRIKDKYIKE